MQHPDPNWLCCYSRRRVSKQFKQTLTWNYCLSIWLSHSTLEQILGPSVVISVFLPSTFTFPTLDWVDELGGTILHWVAMNKGEGVGITASVGSRCVSSTGTDGIRSVTRFECIDRLLSKKYIQTNALPVLCGEYFISCWITTGKFLNLLGNHAYKLRLIKRCK